MSFREPSLRFPECSGPALRLERRSGPSQCLNQFDQYFLTSSTVTQLSELKPKLGWSLRRGLLAIHADLFTIHRLVKPYLGFFPPELTALETLTLVLEDRRFLRHH